MGGGDVVVIQNACRRAGWQGEKESSGFMFASRKLAENTFHTLLHVRLGTRLSLPNAFCTLSPQNVQRASLEILIFLSAGRQDRGSKCTPTSSRHLAFVSVTRTDCCAIILGKPVSAVYAS